MTKHIMEHKLAESFEKTIKNLQKEGLFENVKSFDLDFNGKGINIKLNEGSYPGDRKDKPVVYTNDEANVIDRFDYKYLEKVIDSLGGTKEFTHGKSETEKPHNTKVYYIGGRSDDHEQLFSDDIISYWTIPLTIKDIKLHTEVAVGYDKYNRLSALVGIDNYHGLIEPSIKRILTSIGFEPAISTKSISDEYSDTFGRHYSVSYDKSFTDTAPINALFKSGSIAKVANILRDLKQKLKLINKNWNYNFAKNEKEYYMEKGLIPSKYERKVLVNSDKNTVIASEGDGLIKEELRSFLKDLQEDNKNENIDWKHLYAWVDDNAYEDNVFEGFIEEIKNEGLDFIEDILKIEVRGLNNARKKRFKSIEKNAKRDAAHRYESFKKFSNLKENESSEVTYMQDFSIEDYYNDIDEVEAAASELGISISFDDNEIYATASSEEVLKQFLYDWDLIENDDDFEAGLL